VKVCKTIDHGSQGAIGSLPFSFTLTNNINANVVTQTVTGPYADAGGDGSGAGGNVCTVFQGLAVTDPATGKPIKYMVNEANGGSTYYPSSIDSTGSSNINVIFSNTNATGTACFTGAIKFTFTGPGNAVFIYANTSGRAPACT
jgi:hypothetical protein